MTQYDIYQFAKILQDFIAMSGLSKVKLLCCQAGTGYGGEARRSELPVMFLQTFYTIIELLQ